jgi:hypothetical protein
MKKQWCLGLPIVLLSTLMARAQDVPAAQARPDGSVRLLIAVTTRAGQPVVGLGEQDFTVFDGNLVRPIRSFRPISSLEKQKGQYVMTSVSQFHPAGTYEVIFEGVKARGRRQFHEVGIKVDRQNLEVVTSPGYLTSMY